MNNRNELIIGDQHFYDDLLISGTLKQSQSMTGAELEYDSSVFKIALRKESLYLFDANSEQLFDASGETLLDAGGGFDTAALEVGQEIWWIHDGALQMHHYVSAVDRIGRWVYQITGMSGIGKLANSIHYGGIYSNARLSDVAAEIISEAIPYSVDPSIAGVPVYGWLPVASRRDNLKQLLFATNTAALKDRNGDLFISFLQKDVFSGIPADDIAAGMTIGMPANTKTVSVSEHRFIRTATDEVKTLFAGEIEASALISPKGASLTGLLVTFSGPTYDLAASGTAILESGDNYAILAASTNGTLTGKEMSHSITAIIRPQGAVRTDDTADVSDATLITQLNSESIAEKELSFYGSARTNAITLWNSDAAAGDAVEFINAYEETVRGMLSSRESSMSANLKSDVKIVSDYDPPNPGAAYSKSTVLTGTGTLSVRDGHIFNGSTDLGAVGSTIRAVLIGGAAGGASGEAGGPGGTLSPIVGLNETTSDPNLNYEHSGRGVPGNGGSGGAPGKVFSVALNTAGLGVVFACGSGGLGGAESASAGCSNPGRSGSATTLGPYSSANGTIPESGYTNIITGETFAIPGESGQAGAAGGRYKDNMRPPLWVDAQAGDVSPYVGGTKGATASVKWSSARNEWSYFFGGMGGGAGAGGSGGNGTDGQLASGYEGVGGSGGNGGVGSNGAAGIRYGCGGSGGSGGGSGGDNGGALWKKDDDWYYYHRSYGILPQGSPGNGGNGGAGGNGGNGCIIIYY